MSAPDEHDPMLGLRERLQVFADQVRLEFVFFRGERWLFASQNGGKSGPLGTVESFETSGDSYAHVMLDGAIWREGKVIGSRDDLAFTGELYKPEVEV